jgi:glyoxylase-like metal-dependent hydrolase (beta-lactamase superfamily II)
VISAAGFPRQCDGPEDSVSPRHIAKRLIGRINMMSFYTEAAFSRGGARQLSPLVRRIEGRDPGAKGFTGARTYIVGRGQVALIDPEPSCPALVSAILRETRGEAITDILVTHTHGEPSPLAASLAEWTGARLHTPTDGDRIYGAGWTLQALATPGHTAGHLAFALLEENLLFAGDSVSGWTTAVAVPPGGDLADQVDTLAKLRRRKFARLLPAHGPEVDAPEAFLAGCLDHCRRDERKILHAIASEGGSSAWQLAARLCPTVHGLVQPAAAHAILAHLVRLANQGRLEAAGKPTLNTPFAVALVHAAAA